MTTGLDALTDKEKQALRLIVRGYDAKSAASELGLSVHTVNERLRDARRKLAVSSSREAARMLAQAESGFPKSLADKKLGEAFAPVIVPSAGQPKRGRALAWLAGGMIVMSLVVAMFALATTAKLTAASDGNRPASNASVAAAESDASRAARGWLALLDAGKWNASWEAAGTVFRTRITAEQWAGKISATRNQFGPVRRRALAGAMKTAELPGAPAGEYEIVKFQTDWAKMPGTTERVVLQREGQAWKVVGYFIAP